MLYSRVCTARVRLYCLHVLMYCLHMNMYCSRASLLPTHIADVLPMLLTAFVSVLPILVLRYCLHMHMYCLHVSLLPTHITHVTACVVALPISEVCMCRRVCLGLHRRPYNLHELVPLVLPTCDGRVCTAHM